PAPANPMTAVVHRCYGSADVLEFASLERPVPGDGEVRVRVTAASVNPLDWHFMRGSPYLMRLMSGIGSPKDIRLGADFAGIVDAVGPGVTRFAVGDAVFGGSTGAFAEYLVIGEDRAIAAMPGNVSFDQAAAVGVAGITALQALRDHGRVGPGQRVLINGASGGVGTFAVQIAKATGAEVTGVQSSRNLEMVRGLGADRVIDYTREDYTDGERRYDLVVDMVGNHSVLANSRVLESDGRLVIVGGPKGDWFAPLKGLVQSRLFGPFVEPEITVVLARLRQEDLVHLAGMMERGELTPVIDRRYTLAELPDAIRYSESGRARGKIIVRIRSEDEAAAARLR
ncbi:MAG: NAD(P)-dependent alcohol dehydrogenase, partial [Xanthomonadales bacterium]